MPGQAQQQLRPAASPVGSPGDRRSRLCAGALCRRTRGLFPVTARLRLCRLAGREVLFFLSGLMVSNSPSLRHDLPGFIGARVFRIFPGLIACTLFCMAVMGPIMTRMPLGDYLTHPATRSYANNMLLNLQWTLPGVFEMNRMNAVNGSLWTLPYEVYSYGMLVALSLLGLMATPRLSTVLASGVIAAGFLVPDTMTTLKFGGEARLLPACFAFGVLMALHKDRIEVRASLATGLVLLTLLLKHS